ncbi:MAG: hypothetical protein HYR72_01395 [Deltaproteobacteria bacterium]|nr:hypothetical protein [Deltaproteobacteria bacterium]MBI3391085.1 hypothetical protein [Deltaproteobacteria bacterium]
MTETNGCTTRLISDAPATKDAFGPHHRVAAALADLVRSEDGGRSVGIEGGWGSGKTTVVNLLSAELTNEADITLLPFDAWAHQGDPLRRTFLESLTRHLRQLKWVNPETWLKRTEELARKRTTTNTTTTPKLTALGKQFTLSVLLVPLGLALLGAGLRDEGVTLATRSSLLAWKFLGGVVLSLGPLLVLFANFIVGTLVGLTRPLRTDEAARTDEATKEESWALLVNKAVTQVQTTTIQDPDPTSIEFEDYFGDLLKEALANENRRLLLVLDNLDRVTAADALSILSTLRTFLEQRRDRSWPWFKRLWILILYDPDGIQGLWKDNAGVTESFLAKTFQVRFRVPLPVLSNWVTYLMDLLKEAFPRNHEESEFHSVYRLFAVLRGSSEPPTPRDLKLFVNQLGAIHRQWGDTIPLPDAAYYVLLWRAGERQAPEKIVDGLRKGEIPTREVVGLVSSKVRDHIAVLAFNVEEKLAHQLVLREPVEAALGSGDAGGLGSLASYPGFWAVLESIRLSDWASTENARLANAAHCLVESGLMQEPSQPAQRSILKDLREGASMVHEWWPFDSTTARGLAALCRLLPDSPFARTQLDAILTGVAARSGEEVAPGTVEQWVEGMVLLLGDLKAAGRAQAYAEGLEVAWRPAAYIAACAVLAGRNQSGDFWPLFRSGDPGAVLDAVREVIGSGKFSAQHVSAMRVLQSAHSSVDWGSIVKAVEKRLQADQTCGAVEVGALLNTLCELGGVYKATEERIKALASGGHLLHNLYQAQSGGNEDGVALCSFLYLRSAPTIPAPPTVGNATNGHEVLMGFLKAGSPWFNAKFLDLVLRNHDFPLLLKVADATPISKPLVVWCLKEIAGRDDATEVYTSDVVVQRWELLRAELGDAFRSLLARVSSQLVSDLVAGNFEPEKAGLYGELVHAAMALDHGFAAWCEQGLHAVEMTRWRDELRQNGELVKLVAALVGKGAKLTLPKSYEDALVEFAKLILRGESSPPYAIEGYDDLVKPLSDGGRKMYRRKLYEEAAAMDGNISETFFNLYAAELSDPEVLKGDQHAVFRLFTPLIARRNQAGLQWLRDLLSSHPNLPSEFPPDTVDDLRQRVREALAGPENEQIGSILKEIAELVKLDVNALESVQ